MSKRNALETENITKLFFKFAIPSIFGMLIVSLEIMIDGMFLGRNVGPLGLAAVNLSMPLINFLMSVGLMICVGGGVITSIYFGKKKLNKARELTSITLMLLIGVLEFLSLIVLINLDFFINFLGANEEVYPYVRAYMIPMMIGAFFYTSPIFTETFVKIEEKPNLVFVSGSVCLTFNALLDYLFIQKFQWGMTGGAVATLLACMFGFLALLPNLHFKLPQKSLRIYIKDIKNIFFNGSSEMLSVVSSTFAMYLFNLTLMKKIGVLGVSALTIVFYINQMLNISLYGLSQALQPLVAYNLGARHLDKIKKVLRVSLITGGALGAVAYIGSHIWGGFIIGIFSKGNQELMSLAKTALFYISFAYLISFLNIISTSFLTSIEKPIESVVVSLGRSIVFIAIPLFILPDLIGAKGIWLSIPIAELMCLVVSYFLMKKAIAQITWRLTKKLK
ncbi:MATE family efflux transporter [uncultured Fusobacterium sp.]|jgi:Na+-driven multidrug efflux pump|uniref:MATE family efflux transporter n=1 Tax=uncultured Fusobacterium sp. TaxID=159267 RepID=UPI0015A65BD7|nr:MATE family efflux transporter [uncultured Fusobacterium sp.]